ncbi:MAG: radical SAM protein [Planctomycetaceae bacterium]|nr:MAG: radical SAM protein [Planctomycetaceae bacterium]
MRPDAESPKVSPTLRIAETFVSRQGEGRLTGTNSFFIRTSGCNLRCWFCDTPYASWNPEGHKRTIDQLIRDAIDSGCRHVVLTGGEPLLPALVVELVNRLRQQTLHVTIETAGTVTRELTADLMSISPKLAGSGPLSATDAVQQSETSEATSRVPANRPSPAVPPTPGRSQSSAWQRRHEAARWRPDVIHQLIAQAVDYQLKFVVDQPDDFDSAVEAVREIGNVVEDSVWIMPQGTDETTLDERASWLRPLCDRHGFHFCDRLQIRWYGNRRGT